MKYILIALGSTLLAGCAVTNTLPERPTPDGQDYLAPIHVMVDSPLDAANVRNSLRETGVFRTVEAGAAAPGGYSVRARLDSTRDISTPLLFLSVATLFLIPIPQTYDTQIDYTLMHDDVALKQYHYRNVTRKYTWLLDQGSEMQGQNLDRISQAFAADVQRDHLLPSVGYTQ